VSGGERCRPFLLTKSDRDSARHSGSFKVTNVILNESRMRLYISE